MARTSAFGTIQGEDIVINLDAQMQTAAACQLVGVMAKSHRLSAEQEALLLKSTLKRKEDWSTCFGGGLAAPQRILPEGQAMVGVMGISSRGLAFNAPDGEAVHCMVLLGTSSTERGRRLQVLATLARTIGIDPDFQIALFHTGSSDHASERLHCEESRRFNDALDDDEDSA